MDFRGINKFNVVVNTISGNCFPLTEKRNNFNFAVTVYAILVWLVELSYIASVVIGLLFYVPRSIAFEEGSALSISIAEIITFSIYLHSRRRHVRNLIRELNRILIDSDDLRRCVHDTVEPRKRYLKMYTVMGIFAAFGWKAAPIFKILDNDRFTYTDYTVTAYLPGEPFSVNTFVCGLFLQILGGFYLAFKKISIDIYISYFMTLLTAEYKYVRGEIAIALRRENSNEHDEKSVIIALKKCVQHHSAVIESGQMCIDLMAIPVGLTYVNAILKFCFIGFAYISFGDDYYTKFMFFGYAVSTLIQVYMFCSCVQELLDASTSITDDAFHEDWHGRSTNVKKMFSTIELSSHMECRLTAYRIVDMVTPTLLSILNTAYSVCVLLLRVK